MVGYDFADPNNPDNLVVPFVFVPHGAPMPEQWLADHPGWVKFPATFVRHSPPAEGAAWDGEPQPGLGRAAAGARTAAGRRMAPAPAWTVMDTAAGGDGTTDAGARDVIIDDTAANLAAWRNADSVFADPLGSAGLRRVSDMEDTGGPPQAMWADRFLGIAPARAAETGQDTTQLAAAESAQSNEHNPVSQKVAPNQARIAVLESYLKNPNVRAFLDTIAQTEGADYDSLYGDVLNGKRKTFDDYSIFPGNGKSTASGRYQITRAKFDDMSVKLGLTDFAPHTQDLMATQILIDQGAMKPLLNGNFDAALAKASVPWNSLPQGPGLRNRDKDQHYTPYEQVRSIFEHDLSKLQSSP